jgi:hypothetical protein|tara:strand:+ start:541 stop:693 length:153 start_codon:yes stop_codon:yes gene_type:complete
MCYEWVQSFDFDYQGLARLRTGLIAQSKFTVVGLVLGAGQSLKSDASTPC